MNLVEYMEFGADKPKKKRIRAGGPGSGRHPGDEDPGSTSTQVGRKFGEGAKSQKPWGYGEDTTDSSDSSDSSESSPSNASEKPKKSTSNFNDDIPLGHIGKGLANYTVGDFLKKKAQKPWGYT